MRKHTILSDVSNKELTDQQLVRITIERAGYQVHYKDKQLLQATQAGLCGPHVIEVGFDEIGEVGELIKKIVFKEIGR